MTEIAICSAIIIILMVIIIYQYFSINNFKEKTVPKLLKEARTKAFGKGIKETKEYIIQDVISKLEGIIFLNKRRTTVDKSSLHTLCNDILNLIK